jgi:hypothetical protein
VKHYKMHEKHIVLLNLQYFSNLRDFENKHKKVGVASYGKICYLCKR